MTQRKAHNPAWPWTKDFRISQAMQVGDTIYVSGQGPLDSEGQSRRRRRHGCTWCSPRLARPWTTWSRPRFATPAIRPPEGTWYSNDSCRSGPARNARARL